MTLRALLILICVSLAACESTTTHERAEFIETPAMSRTLAQPGARAATDWPRENWWRAYRSAELDRVMAKALVDNQNLARAQDRLREADAIAKVEGARLFPAIDFDAGLRNSRIPQNGVVASYNPAQGGLNKTMAFINPLSLRYEFDFWGKNRSALNAALGEAAAREAEAAEVRLLLTAAVARAYFRGRAASRQLALARDMTRLRREIVSLSQTRFSTGIDTQDGVALAQADLAVAEKREAAVAATLAIQKDLLARLMGEGPDAAIGLFAAREAGVIARPALPKRLPVELLAHRPDVSAAMHRAEA
ncbi:MAG: TolC family protein, partial [Methylocystis sp.]|nr:TolC family protein [Methylocystis sp.]